jgi:hypothetical protein
VSNTPDYCKSSLGISYHAGESCRFLLECAFRKDEAFSFSSGLEYELDDRFYVRMGLYTKPLTPTFGISFSLSPFSVDVACDKHQVLGYSTMLGISYQF